MCEKFQLKVDICEPCSDISPNWEDIRTKFGYTMLYEIPNPFEKTKSFISIKI
jgi:hypothetical protein